MAGNYIRTEEHKRISAENFRKVWSNDYEKMRVNCSRGGRAAGGKGIKRWMKENPEEHRENCRRAGSISCKNRWKNDRERMLEICHNAGKNMWQEKNLEAILEGCRKGGRVANGKGLKDRWKNKREEMLKISGQGFRIAWKNNREKMIDLSIEAGKIGGKVSIQKQQKLYPSPIELIVRNYLDKNKIRHKDNVWFDHKEADIVIPRYKLIIECDGWMHDVYENVKKNDKLKTKLFNKLGYKVLRLKGSEIRNGSFVNKFLKKIANIKPRVLLRRRENYETNRV